MKELIIGPLPPPIGGVSNHVLRYSQKNKVRAKSEKSIKSLKGIVEIFFSKNTKFIIHSASWYVAFLMSFKAKVLSRNCKYCVVNHNFRIFTNRKKGLKSKIQQFFRYRLVRLCDTVYIVNKDLLPMMKQIYGDINYQIFDPFVPPDETKETQIWETYDAGLLDFTENHKPIICSGAWQISIYNGEDLYGLDLLIDLVAKMKENHPNIGFVFFLGNPIYNKEYLSLYEIKIKKKGLAQNIFFVKGQKELWPFLKKSDLYIRATNTDGDPLSIKEALHFGTKVLASDCTERHQGVKVFKTRNLDSLYKQTSNILNHEKKQ